MVRYGAACGGPGHMPALEPGVAIAWLPRFIRDGIAEERNIPIPCAAAGRGWRRGFVSIFALRLGCGNWINLPGWSATQAPEPPSALRAQIRGRRGRRRCAGRHRAGWGRMPRGGRGG